MHPTEDLGKVKTAVENIFGALTFKVEDRDEVSILTAETENMDLLNAFQESLRRDRIRDAARRVLLGGLERNIIVFYLNKQAAYAGHVSFSEPIGESPLGPISVQVECESARELIEWLAPKTL